MLNQEELYNLLLKKEWNKILDNLYKEKENIKNDILLTHASQTFVNEFLIEVEKYELDDKEILETLQNLNILHCGKFYILSENDHKKIIHQLIIRTPLKEAYGYAKNYPNDLDCKNVIDEYNKLNKKSSLKIEKKEKLSSEIYNRLFEIINQNDTATYFSGPRFIDTVRTYLPYYPSYSQYIEQRNEQGKSTSRKIYYYDILNDLDLSIREKVINRILEITKPFEKEKVTNIEKIINGDEYNNVSSEEISASHKKNSSANEFPTVFISYSWDNEEHKKWVLDLANRLAQNGVKVILDRYYLRPGVNLPHFVDENLDKADKVLMIFTPNYKLKADKRTGGVGYEYSIMNVKVYKNIAKNDKIIPILRQGTIEDSIPTFMQQFIHIDARNDDNIDNSFNDLIREIFNEPEIKIPEIGKKPNF